MVRLPEPIQINEGNPDGRDLRHAALATNVQFRALGHLLRPEQIASVPRTVFKAKSFRKGGTYELNETRKWLRNAWNTELILRMQCDFDEEMQRFALQWAFSQAYYSCFCQVLSFFVSCGQTQRSHAAVLKQFGVLIQEGKYPAQIAWYASGGMRNISIHGLRKESYDSPHYLELSEPESVETQGSQFLKSTREMTLKEKRESEKDRFLTKKGKQKKKLAPQDWEWVAGRIGFTTVMDLLRRKRIKANYREIDTFLRSEISTRCVLGGLINIVNSIALVHESILASTLGPEEFEKLTGSTLEGCSFVEERKALIMDEIA